MRPLLVPETLPGGGALRDEVLKAEGLGFTTVCGCAEHVTQAFLEGGASIRGVILCGSGWLVDVLEGEAGRLHS